MITFNKKAFKGLPTAIRVRKPRYYYKDFVEIYTENTTKDINLTEFEGLDYELNYSTLTFNNKKLWNNDLFEGSTRALAPLYEYKVINYGGYSVVGSLTNENNVFSGFSGSNYLSLNGDFNVGSNTWEVVAKFTTTNSFPNLQGIYHFHNALSDSGRYGLIIRMQGNKFNFVASSGYSWLFNSTGSYTIQPNTTYWVKATFDGSRYVLSYSLDGKYFIEDISYSSTSTLLSGLNIMVAGVWYTGSSYYEPLLGTLDLNECYMKIGDNLVWTPEVIEEIQQYTPEYLTSVRKLVYGVNGSPTIVDNVASGFSSSDYVTIDAPKFSEADNWEIFAKITTGNDVTSPQYLYQISKATADSGRFGVVLFISTDNNTLSFKPNLSFTGSAWAATSDFTSEVNNNYTFEANTTYYTKLSFDGNCYKVEVSKNNIDWDVAYEAYTTTKICSGLTYTRIGSYNNSSNYFKGSIDLNESYIKLDGVEVWGNNAKNVISVTELKGCLDEGLTDNSDETIYNAFVKDSDILLTNKEDVEGMFWANRVIIPSHLKAGVYLKNYSQVGSLNIDLGYNASGFGKGAVIYSPIIKANTTDETLCYVFKVKPGKVESTWRILMGNKGGLNHLMGVGDGKWFLWNVSTPAEGGTYEFGSSYWVAVMVYPDQTIVYYMKDDGTFNDVSKIPLPAIRGMTQPYWSVGPTVNTNLFMNTAKWIGAGNDNSDQYWSGSVDIKNTIVYKNHNNFMANTEIVWQPLLTVSEPDKLPDKEWM